MRSYPLYPVFYNGERIDWAKNKEEALSDAKARGYPVTEIVELFDPDTGYAYQVQ